MVLLTVYEDPPWDLSSMYDPLPLSGHAAEQIYATGAAEVMPTPRLAARLPAALGSQAIMWVCAAGKVDVRVLVGRGPHGLWRLRKMAA